MRRLTRRYCHTKPNSVCRSGSPQPSTRRKDRLLAPHAGPIGSPLHPAHLVRHVVAGKMDPLPRAGQHPQCRSLVGDDARDAPFHPKLLFPIADAKLPWVSPIIRIAGLRASEIKSVCENPSARRGPPPLSGSPPFPAPPLPPAPWQDLRARGDAAFPASGQVALSPPRPPQDPRRGVSSLG